jgi:carbon starvation protein CstA
MRAELAPLPEPSAGQRLARLLDSFSRPLGFLYPIVEIILACGAVLARRHSTITTTTAERTVELETPTRCRSSTTCGCPR